MFSENLSDRLGKILISHEKKIESMNGTIIEKFGNLAKNIGMRNNLLIFNFVSYPQGAPLHY